MENGRRTLGRAFNLEYQRSKKEKENEKRHKVEVIKGSEKRNKEIKRITVVKSFQQYSSLEKHLDCGKHRYAPIAPISLTPPQI